MATAPRHEFPFPPKRRYSGADVPMRVIRRYARAIGEEFHPDKVILFGSYAYGTPHEDSDVDLLVVMPAWNQHSQAVKIRLALTAPFPMDLIVRTPKEMKWRLEEGESFLTEIVSKGKVLYEKDDRRRGFILNLTPPPRRPTIALFKRWRSTEEGEDSWPFPRGARRVPARATGAAIIT